MLLTVTNVRLDLRKLLFNTLILVVILQLNVHMMNIGHQKLGNVCLKALTFHLTQGSVMVVGSGGMKGIVKKIRLKHSVRQPLVNRAVDLIATVNITNQDVQPVVLMCVQQVKYTKTEAVLVLQIQEIMKIG